ncbi:MAG: hypothetical protein V7L22_21880 [Nostoc sp.]|uniref:hypothetical protein n=1 Tax=Nostoc sp. TaxID=1180 RepID=UPI002FF59916
MVLISYPILLKITRVVIDDEVGILGDRLSVVKERAIAFGSGIKGRSILDKLIRQSLFCEDVSRSFWGWE